VCCITETWLEEQDTQICSLLCPEGHDILTKSRSENGLQCKKRGGGIAFICKKSFDPKLCKSIKEYESFEYTKLMMKIRSKQITVIIVYRSPSLSKSQFIKDFTEFITDNVLNNKSVLICGDFNISFEDMDDCYLKKVHAMLDMFDLNQRVNVTTH
jgi:exonuclease III